MTPAARSVCYFGFYLYLVGLTLIFVPNTFLKLMQMPETTEPWIRLLGVLAFNVGYYYHRMGVKNYQPFFKLTIPTRFFVFITCAVFVMMKYVSVLLLGVGAIDFLGAVWTWMALRNAPAGASA